MIHRTIGLVAAAMGIWLMAGGSASAQTSAKSVVASATVEPVFIGGAGLQQEGDFGAFFGTVGEPIVSDSAGGVDEETTWTGFWRVVPVDRTSGVREVMVPWSPAGSGIQSALPNPFSVSTRIEVNLARPGHLLVTLHDNLGREVVRLLDAPREAGTVVLDWRPDALPTGTYLLRMQVEGREFPARMIQYYR